MRKEVLRQVSEWLAIRRKPGREDILRAQSQRRQALFSLSLSPDPFTINTLYYGDNLEVLRKYVKDETIDLCYIDPPLCFSC